MCRPKPTGLSGLRLGTPHSGVMNTEGLGAFPGPLCCHIARLADFGLYQAVIPIAPPVDNVDLPGVRVVKDKETVA